MKVLILVILFTMCSAHEDFFNTILRELEGLSKATRFMTVNDTQLHSISLNHCKCEETFVQNLNESIKLINSPTHKDHLYNIIDMLNSQRPSPNTEKPMNNCEKKIIRKRRFSRDPVKSYITSSINFIKKWNKANCILNSIYS